MGTGYLEQELVNIHFKINSITLFDFKIFLKVSTIEKTLQEKKDVQVKMLFDYSRGLRGNKNSKTMLQSLVSDFENRFNLFLYHTPNLRGIVKKILPERTNETIGVMHMKIYITDNELIISG